MKRFVIFVALFPPLAMIVFLSPDAVSKGIPSSEDLLAWLIASYPITIIPASLMAGVDRALSAQPLPVLKTAAVGGLAAVLLALFLSGGYAGFWPVVMVFLVGAVPAALCSWLSAIGDLDQQGENQGGIHVGSE